MKVTANAQRSGDWWAIEVPEVPGVFTQAKRLDQVEAMVRDAVALMEDVAEHEVEVEIVVGLERELAEALAEAKAARVQAEQLSERAAAGIRETAHALAGQGFSLRDIGVILGVSHQRVAQLLDPVGPRSIKEHGEAHLRAVRGGKKDVVEALGSKGNRKFARGIAAKAAGDSPIRKG